MASRVLAAQIGAAATGRHSRLGERWKDHGHGIVHMQMGQTPGHREEAGVLQNARLALLSPRATYIHTLPRPRLRAVVFFVRLFYGFLPAFYRENINEISCTG